MNTFNVMDIQRALYKTEWSKDKMRCGDVKVRVIRIYYKHARNYQRTNLISMGESFAFKIIKPILNCIWGQERRAKNRARNEIQVI